MERKINLLVIIAVFLGAVVVCSLRVFAAPLMIANFEHGNLDDVGGKISTWTSNSLDTTQGCRLEIVPLYSVMGKGDKEAHVLRVGYDVASTGPAINGIRMGLNNIDLSRYDQFSMLIKGNPTAGFTTQFKLEFINNRGERAGYLLKGITDQWQRIAIPMKNIKSGGSMKDWSNMRELLFRFDDLTVTQKEGVLYIDEVAFSFKE